MSSPEDFVRSFGMSGFLITDELRLIEQRFGIELGHTPKSAAVSSVEFYPQFEQAVRVEASDMSEHYELFYCLEQSIRLLIGETLTDAAGPDWWNSGKVPQKIHDDVASRVRREDDSGVTRRSDDLIDYTTFGELTQVITSNWDLFATVLSNPRAVERVMSGLNLLRGPIAHCCPIADDEVERLHLAVKDWFRLIG